MTRLRIIFKSSEQTPWTKGDTCNRYVFDTVTVAVCACQATNMAWHGMAWQLEAVSMPRYRMARLSTWYGIRLQATVIAIEH